MSAAAGEVERGKVGIGGFKNILARLSKEGGVEISGVSWLSSSPLGVSRVVGAGTGTGGEGVSGVGPS